MLKVDNAALNVGCFHSHLRGGCPVQRPLSGSVKEKIRDGGKMRLDGLLTERSYICATQSPISIYQPVQGVMDLMDARQSTQVGIQLKI